LIDQKLAPNLTFIAFVNWTEVLLLLPWLFLAGIAISAGASSLTLRRYLKD
jgi:cell division protein FtsX